MPSKRKQLFEAKPVPKLNIPAALLDQVVKGPMTQEEVEAVWRSLKKAVIERAMGGEMAHHLGYPPGEAKSAEQANYRNGTSSKKGITDDGAVHIEVPRDRDGSFEPQIIPKHARGFTGFDDKIIALYARGMTVREIQGFLAENYGTQVSGVNYLDRSGSSSPSTQVSP